MFYNILGDIDSFFNGAYILGAFRSCESPCIVHNLTRHSIFSKYKNEATHESGSDELQQR